MELYMVDKPDGKSEKESPVCGRCALCIHTNEGEVCQLTDNETDYDQEGCVDFIWED